LTTKHTKHTEKENNTKNSPTYKGGVAAASADGVVLSAINEDLTADEAD
jgi:hypothetical protein